MSIVPAFGSDDVVSRSQVLRGTLGDRLMRNRLRRADRPFIPMIIYPESNCISYPRLLSSVTLANSSQGTVARVCAFTRRVEFPEPIPHGTACPIDGSFAGPRQFRDAKRNRAVSIADVLPHSQSTTAPLNTADDLAFNDDALFRD